MDFARKQLEKYGWTDGKGLGRHENGISEALKPKIKRSAAGIGHDPASEFNEHWWTALYDKAAGNVEVQEKNGKTKKIKTKEDFEITNSTWKLKQKPKDHENEEQYSDFFVRTAVLTNGGSKVEKVRESDSESEGEEKRDVFKMTDEELFKACEGRTAHKGARHGLKATGKLARIAQQEALLLTEKRFNGYSHAKKLQDKQVDKMNLDSDSEVKKTKKKKKKRKRCNSNEKQSAKVNKHDYMEDVCEVLVPENVAKTQDDDVTCVIKQYKKGKKRNHLGNIEEITDKDEVIVPQKKKNKQKTDHEIMEDSNITENLIVEDINKNKKNKKKEKYNL